MQTHCVFVLGDSSGVYYRNTYITLLSLLDNTERDLVVHIIHDETIKHGRADLESLCTKYGREIKFHAAPAIPPDVFRFTVAQRAPFLYKLCIHECVEADTAVYLDADLIVQCDIAELAAAPLDGKLIGAVRNAGGHWRRNGRVKKENSRLVAEVGLKPETYFNSGVMVMDLQKIRALSKGSNPFFDAAVRYADKKIRSPYMDQDIFNAVCARHGGVALLDPRFNHLAYAKGNAYDDKEARRGKIIHYSAPQSKPQAVIFPAQLIYWKYYAMTPWGGDVFERMDEVFFQPRMDFLKNYVLHPGRRGILARYAAGGFPGLFAKK